MSEVAQAPHSSPDGRIPQLRFPEFSGNWEEVPFYDCLNDILDFRGRTPLKIGMDWGGGNIISLSANNVKNGYIDFNAECHLGSGELYEKWMGKVKLVKNDIVFTMEAPLGKALLVPDDKRYILSQRVVAFKTKDYIDNLYFIQLIWSNKFQNTVDRLSTGSTAKGINQKSLKKVFVNIPLKPEQQKIAAFLTAVDTKIEQLSKKKALLGEYKKGLMQQIFSQVIRFKADDGCDFPDWEEKKLGGIGSFYRGHTYNSTNVKNNGLLVLRSSNIKNDKLVLDKDLQFVDKICSDKISLRTDDIVICMANGSKHLVGKSGVYYGDYDNKLTVGAFCSIFRTDNKLSKYILQTVQYKRYLHILLAGTNINNLKNSELAELKFNLPVSINEQTKIANFLSSIDSKIEQVSKQLVESKQFKKALLQQMFV